MVDRNNYNIDYRLFLKEKLRSAKWLAWLGGGVLVCSVPLLLDPSYLAFSVGLLISWLCILFAITGVVWNDANEKTLRKFTARHQLIYNPRLAAKHPDGRELADSSLEVHLANVIDLSRVNNIVFNDVLTNRSKDSLQIVVCKLSFEYSTVTERQLYQYSLVMCTNMQTSFPDFAVDSGKVYDIARFVKFNNKEKLLLEGSFGRNHNVYVSPQDRINMLSFFSPDVMKLYEKYFSHSSLVSKNGRLAIFSHRDIFSNDEYEDTYKGIEKLRTKIERYNKRIV